MSPRPHIIASSADGILAEQMRFDPRNPDHRNAVILGALFGDTNRRDDPAYGMETDRG